MPENIKEYTVNGCTPIVVAAKDILLELGERFLGEDWH
ncbi:hypothetical protein NIES932_10930 [Raphidiopsis curvata NIES-932]|nr:hypothetical protein NIES932_10930 [Raphidiopsis curvata NIES-932]